ALGRLTPLPDTQDDGRQAMPNTGKPCTTKARHRSTFVWLVQPFDQPYRIDQEGTDYRWIKTLVVQHQHRVVQPRTRIHNEAARARLRWPLTKVGRNESLAMHQRNVQMFERRYRTTAAVSRQACHRSTLEQEGQQL